MINYDQRRGLLDTERELAQSFRMCIASQLVRPSILKWAQQCLTATGGNSKLCQTQIKTLISEGTDILNTYINLEQEEVDLALKARAKCEPLRRRVAHMFNKMTDATVREQLDETHHVRSEYEDCVLGVVEPEAYAHYKANCIDALEGVIKIDKEFTDDTEVDEHTGEFTEKRSADLINCLALEQHFDDTFMHNDTMIKYLHPHITPKWQMVHEMKQEMAIYDSIEREALQKSIEDEEARQAEEREEEKNKYFL
eukprot:GEZU01023169.1.p1 GENE.GEZU01023169.1~~GEZU01023169.1.p1  ORF type:complete len:254 (-),score=68.95 GEZU01023169.1:38-799(-)